VGVVLRALFVVAAIGGLVGFLYVYRRRTNAIVAIVVGSYVVMAGLRLLAVESDVPTVLLALGGLGVLWGAVWLGTRWAERHGWP
jgi:uncharacterized membrane protein (UPF0136 family)